MSFQQEAGGGASRLTKNMADYTLNVSLKANPFPYGLIAQATFVDIETSFHDTAENDVTLSHHGELVTDQAQIVTLLAGKAAVLEGSSSVRPSDHPFASI